MTKLPDFVHEDRDLFGVLKKATDQELGMLVETLCTKASCELKPDSRYVPAIVNEFQLMGGNSIVNARRGHGVSYAEIVDDVASKVGADLKGAAGIVEKEWRIVEHLVEQAEEKMDEAERQAFYEEVRKQSGNQDFRSVRDLLLHQAVFNAVRLVILRIVVRQLLVRLGVGWATRLIGGRLVMLLGGPLGWVLGGIWAAIDLSGPGYSVTVPGVMIVAMIRARRAAEDASRDIGGQG